MATVKRFEDLEIWQKSRELCKYVETIIENGQFRHNFSLIDQMRRSSGSIMDNIAEGFERGGNKEFTHFLFISKGSTGELRSQSYRAHDNGYLTDTEFDHLLSESNSLSERIGKFISYLKKSDYTGTKFKKE